MKSCSEILTTQNLLEQLSEGGDRRWVQIVMGIADWRARHHEALRASAGAQSSVITERVAFNNAVSVAAICLRLAGYLRMSFKICDKGRSQKALHSISATSKITTTSVGNRTDRAVL
jgi:hypothetical protein